MLCRAIGINDAAIRSQSRRTFLRNASGRDEPTADRMRPTMVLDCPMKVFTNRFSAVSVVGLILRSDTTSGRRPRRRSASHAADGESDDGSTAVPVLVTRSRGVVCASTLIMASIWTSRRWLHQRRCGSLRINSSAGSRQHFRRGPVRKDVAQVDEGVVENVVTQDCVDFARSRTHSFSNGRIVAASAVRPLLSNETVRLPCETSTRQSG